MPIPESVLAEVKTGQTRPPARADRNLLQKVPKRLADHTTKEDKEPITPMVWPVLTLPMTLTVHICLAHTVEMHGVPPVNVVTVPWA